MKHLGDITKINGAEIPKVDVITGGSPCQDLSIAGGHAGLAGERSHLFMEQIRIVKEMREDDRESGRAADYIRPRFMVWENVPGAFSSNKGEDFGRVLTEIVRIAEPKSPAVPMPARGGGSGQDACMMEWADGPLLGEYMMRSFGESPKEENASLLSLTLEASVPQRYYLSAKACAGILRRAEKMGKELPEALRAALLIASRSEQASPEAAKES